MEPQFLPCAAQVVGMQLPPHVLPHRGCASDTQVESHNVVQQYESALHTVVAQLEQLLTSAVLLTAVQVQVAALAVTVIDPVPPVAGNDWLVGEMVNVQFPDRGGTPSPCCR
jgi:hypothetical protein